MSTVNDERAEPAGARILVVDDEESITQLVATALRYEGFEVESAAGRPRRRQLARELPARPGRARRDAARPRRVRGATAGSRPTAIAVPVVFLTARDTTDGQRARPDARRRRLRRQAVQPRGAGRPGARGAAPHPRPTPGRDRCCATRTSSSTRTPTRCAAASRAIELTPTEYNLLHYLLTNAGRVLSQGADPRPRVALRLRRRHQRGRDLHQLPAQEGRQPARRR